jgi:hypothetical protein
MGGLSKWNILRDAGLSTHMPQIFGAVPEVLSGVLTDEAQQVWRDWNPLAWQMIKFRGLLIEPCSHDGRVHVQPAHGRSLWQSANAVRTERPTVNQNENAGDKPINIVAICPSRR